MRMKKATVGTGPLLIDCGSVTERTRGLPLGFFREGAPPPFNWTIFY